MYLMKLCGSGAGMVNSKIAIDDLRRIIYKYVHDYEIIDLMEDYLDVIEKDVDEMAKELKAKDGNKISVE